MEEGTKTPTLVSKEKKKQKSEKRRSSKQEDVSLPASPEEGELQLFDVNEEKKKLKESLLQSISTSNDSSKQVISESAVGVSEERQRKRSGIVPVSAPLIAGRNVLAELDEAKLFELKEAFMLFDLDGDGCIDHNDLRGTLISLGEQVDEQAVCNMLSEASNPLDFEGFVNLLGYQTLELDTEETLVAALSRWDGENTGLISEDRIRHDLMSWGDKFTEKEADYALDEAPVVQKGGRSMIDYPRFCAQLCGFRKSQKTCKT